MLSYHVNRSEIWRIIKRELLGLKCVGNTTRQLTTPNESPRLVGKGTVWYPSTNSSLQISILHIHQIFNTSYFLQFNLSFEKKYLFPAKNNYWQCFSISFECGLSQLQRFSWVFPCFLSQAILKTGAATRISLKQKKILNIAIICLQSIPDVIFYFLKVLKDVWL